MTEKSWSREWLEAILIAVVFALFVRTFVAQAFKIPSGSMEDSLLVGDHLFVNKFIYAPHFDTPLYAVLPYRVVRRGDVVVFRYPADPRLDYIKRAVAVGGDELEIRAKRLLVNGQAEARGARGPQGPVDRARRREPAGRGARSRPFRTGAGAGRLGVLHGRQP